MPSAGYPPRRHALGATPTLYSLDTSRPEAPTARTLPEDIARIVHGRLVHPRWIAGQLAHGWRGAAELAEAIDTLFVFAAGTDAVPHGLFDTVFDAWCADAAVWTALETANAAGRRRDPRALAEAQQRGLWTSRRNSVGAFLARQARGMSAPSPPGAAARLVPEHASPDGDRRWLAGAPASARRRPDAGAAAAHRGAGVRAMATG